MRTRTYVYGIAALFGDVSDGTESTRAEHNLVVVNEGVLVHAPEDVTSRYMVPDLHVKCLIRATSQRLLYYIPCS